MYIYVLQVIGGMEHKISYQLDRKGIRTIIPSELALMRSGGKWREQERLLFPGYVFVGMECSVENYYTVKSVDGIVRFFKNPLSSAEAERIGWLENNGEVIAPSVIEYDGHCFKAVSGILKDNDFRILKLDRHQKKAYVKLTIAGEPKVIKLSAEIIKRAENASQG